MTKLLVPWEDGAEVGRKDSFLLGLAEAVTPAGGKPSGETAAAVPGALPGHLLPRDGSTGGLFVSIS